MPMHRVAGCLALVLQFSGAQAFATTNAILASGGMTPPISSNQWGGGAPGSPGALAAQANMNSHTAAWNHARASDILNHGNTDAHNQLTSMSSQSAAQAAAALRAIQANNHAASSTPLHNWVLPPKVPTGSIPYAVHPRDPLASTASHPAGHHAAATRKPASVHHAAVTSRPTARHSSSKASSNWGNWGNSAALKKQGGTGNADGLSNKQVHGFINGAAVKTATKTAFKIVPGLKETHGVWEGGHAIVRRHMPSKT